MELAFALGMADASWSPELAALLPLVESGDVRILGARDAELLRTEGVSSLRDHLAIVDGDRLAADPTRAAVSACASLSDPWWFHLDLDVLSTEALPAVDYPQPGGLDWEGLASVATTALSADPRGWDITIYNPDLDPERIHARHIIRFIGSMVEQVSGLQPI
jgi:arginase